MKGLLALIFRSSIGDCSHGGVSGRADRVVVVDNAMPGVFAPDARTPAVKLVQRGKWLHAEPVERRAGAGPMFGGTFIWSSDSRFRAVSEYPIPLHDRWEA